MDRQKIVVLGVGFAGLRFAHKLSANSGFDITIIDRLNYHQFQPLLYQVATSGVEPSSISFPLRKALRRNNLRVRIGEVQEVDTAKKLVKTSAGAYPYDKLVIALGASTNFFGNEQLQKHCLTMKSVPESLVLRNTLLENFERAVICQNVEQQDAFMNIVIVGGGATGVELAGALADMKKKVLPKDYPELDVSRMKISLIEAGDRLLASLSEYSSTKAIDYLTRLGVDVMTGSTVKSYDGQTIETSTATLHSRCVIWTAGVKANKVNGLDECKLGRGGRIITDQFNAVDSDIYAIGDIAYTTEEHYPNGHPQVAPVAIQQADNLARNLINESQGKAPRPFHYKNKGSMATIGRNLAVVEVGKIKFSGFFAWLTWMFVHLMSIVGVRNRVWIFFGWLWQYFTYDVSLRLIIKPASCDEKTNQ